MIGYLNRQDYRIGNARKRHANSSKTIVETILCVKHYRLTVNIFRLLKT